MNLSYTRHQLAYFLPAALWTLWQAMVGWLCSYLAQQRLGDAYAPYNYVLFFVALAAGTALCAFLLDKSVPVRLLRLGALISCVLAVAFTALMAVAQGALLMIASALSGIAGGCFAALLSRYLYMGIPAESRGISFGVAAAAGYALHYVLFTLLFPGTGAAALQVEAIFAGLLFLFIGALALLSPLCGVLLAPENAAPKRVASNRHAPVMILVLITVLFSLSYGAQDLAATVYWMRGGAFLVHTRAFVILGFFTVGLLWNSKRRIFLLSGGFVLLALGFLAMAVEYKGMLSFLGLVGVQLASACFTLSMRLLFFDAAGFYKYPVFVGALGLALPMMLKQVGILCADALYTRMGGASVFIGALLCIALGFPLIAFLFERLRALQAADMQEQELVHEWEQPREADSDAGISWDQAVLSTLVNRYGFTRREAQILELAIHGLPNAQIAERLSIREATVKQHIRNMLSKTDKRSLKQLILSEISATPASSQQTQDA